MARAVSNELAWDNNRAALTRERYAKHENGTREQVERYGEVARHLCKIDVRFHVSRLQRGIARLVPDQLKLLQRLFGYLNFVGWRFVFSMVRYVACSEADSNIAHGSLRCDVTLAVQDDDVVCIVEVTEGASCHNRRRSQALQAAVFVEDGLEHVQLCFPIEAAERVIKQHDLLARIERACERHSGLLSAAESCSSRADDGPVALGKLCNIWSQRARGNHGVVPFLVPCRHANDVLPDCAPDAPRGLRAVGRLVEAGLNYTSGEGHLSQQQLQECGLTGAYWPVYHDNLAAWYMQRDIGEDRLGIFCVPCRGCRQRDQGI